MRVVALLSAWVLAWAPGLCRGEVRFVDTEVDLGEVRAGIRLNRELALLNDGADEATILEVRGSCGCLAASVEPAVLAPGGQGRLLVRLNTLGEGAGPHAWKASVRYRQGGQVKDVEMTLRARIISEITVQPASLTLVTQGGKSQSVVLTDHRPQPMKIKSVATTASFLKGTLLGQGQDTRGNWTAKIALDIGPDVPSGRHDQVLSIYSDDPLYGELRVPVVVIKATAAASVTADPPSVRFSRDGQTTSRMVRLRPASGHTIQIEKVDVDDPALTCKWASGPERDVFLRIQADFSHVGAVPRRTVVNVHLTAPAHEVLTIPVLFESDERETAER